MVGKPLTPESKAELSAEYAQKASQGFKFDHPRMVTLSRILMTTTAGSVYSISKNPPLRPLVSSGD